MNDQLAKIRRLRAMQYRREQNVMSDLDIYAMRIGKFVRKIKYKFGAKDFVEYNGLRYPFSVALQLAEDWDESGRIAIDRKLIDNQNKELVIENSKIIDPSIIQGLYLTFWVNTKKYLLNEIVYPTSTMDNGIFELLQIVEFEELLRRPFKKNDDANLVAYWFRVFIVSQMYERPDWLDYPLTREELIIKAESEMNLALNRIRNREIRMMEILKEPEMDEEIGCTMCQVEHKVSEMKRKNDGSFYFCRSCAFQMGIISSDSGDSDISPMEDI